MSNRITQRDLEAVVLRLNKITGSPESTYIKDSKGKFVSQIGNYHLNGAYGGWSLHRICNASGGVSDVLRSGHVSKREIFTLIQAYITGLIERGES